MERQRVVGLKIKDGLNEGKKQSLNITCEYFWAQGYITMDESGFSSSRIREMIVEFSPHMPKISIASSVLSAAVQHRAPKTVVVWES